MFNQALAGAGQEPFGEDGWVQGVLALAIDPLFAPALLTVGSVEYQSGREKQAMEMFTRLTTLPPDEPDLPETIDKAGDFLLDEEDFEAARDLYAAAEKAHPDVAVYPIGFCFSLEPLGITVTDATRSLGASGRASEMLSVRRLAGPRRSGEGIEPFQRWESCEVGIS